ncbi:hypothetical protein PIB30_038159 [Stylosanthes scabra]|uniref:CCHC-type domain-containing protein n=1 Tax=Stylosanthes scabra TaxID=79078 RepID=A0ABU6XCE9_9FABA|nr:hypothetical protein [Stylosanthes scabra]
MTRLTAKVLGRQFGADADTKDPVVNNLLYRSYLRSKTLMDITRPLPTDIWLTRSNLPKVWISFKYERIQDSYCLKCGIIGHNKKECNKPVAATVWNPLKPRYLPGLGVSRPPQIHEMEELGVQNYAAASGNYKENSEKNVRYQADRLTNHPIRGMESQGEAMHMNTGSSNPPHFSHLNDQPQKQAAGINNQHQQPPDRYNEELNKDDQATKESYSVNQQIDQLQPANKKEERGGEPTVN